MKSTTSHKTTNKATPHLDKEITKNTQKQFFVDICHLFRSKEREKDTNECFYVKNDIKQPLLDKERKKN